MTAPSFAGEHLCICARWVHEHSFRDCTAEMEGPWTCQSDPAHCCADCLCGSFQDAHPSDYQVASSPRPCVTADERRALDAWLRLVDGRAKRAEATPRIPELQPRRVERTEEAPAASR